MARARRHSTTAASLLAAALLWGCGGSDGSAETTPREATATLTAEERRDFDRSIRAIQRHCRRWAESVATGRGLEGDSLAEADAAVERMLDLLRAKPRAPIGRSADVRLRVGDIAESVEGANCDPRIERRLDEGIAAAVAGG